ncbi:MAG: anti-sigma factor [Planctomycetota bacterium]
MEERRIAGLGCRDVLAMLTDYFDGELDHSVRTRIEAHVAGCDLCARFGGSFATLVQSLRDRLHDVQPVPTDVAARLMHRVAKLSEDDEPRLREE